MKLIYVMVLALCVLTSAVNAAEEAQPAAAPVELYKEAEGIDLPMPRYPESERRRGGEGWVMLNMMVDPQGKPYEATVADSTGDPAFEKAALAAVEKWHFEPASLNGAPIDAGYSHKITFVLTDDPTASRPFIRLYRELLDAIQAGDRERADSLLALMHVHNLYEDAFRGLASFTYYRKWGTEAQQLGALRRAVAGEESATYLPKDKFAAALQEMLALEIKVSTGTSWNYELLKRRFQIEVASGKIAEIKLRCDRQYVFFHFDPKLQYTIGGNDRSCSMEVVGDPGTKFRLTQL